MAEYTKVIAFQVKDEKIQAATKRLFSSLERIEKKLGEINKKPAFRGITSDADRAKKKVDALNESLTRNTKITEEQTKKVKTSMGVWGKTRRLVAETSAAYWGLLAATDKLSPSVVNLSKWLSGLAPKWMGLEGVLKGVTGSVAAHAAGITALLSAYGPLLHTVGALTGVFILFGKSIFPLMGKVSKLGAAARRLVRDLKDAEKGLLRFLRTTRAPKTAPTIFDSILQAKGGGLVGLNKLLSDVTASQAKLISTNRGYVAQTIKVREVEKSLNQELRERQKILDQLIRKEKGDWVNITANNALSGGGLSGLKQELDEAVGIQNRMLSTDSQYKAQTQTVLKLQEAINRELKRRKAITESIVKEETKSASLWKQAIGDIGLAFNKIVGLKQAQQAFNAVFSKWGSGLTLVAFGSVFGHFEKFAKWIHLGNTGLGKFLTQAKTLTAVLGGVDIVGKLALNFAPQIMDGVKALIAFERKLKDIHVKPFAKGWDRHVEATTKHLTAGYGPFSGFGAVQTRPMDWAMGIPSFMRPAMGMAFPESMGPGPMGWMEGSLDSQKKELDAIARSEGRFGDKSLMVAGIQKEINRELAARNRILLASNQLIDAGYTQAQQVRALRKLDASSADLPPGWGSSKRWKYERQIGDTPLDQLRRLPGGFTPGRTARFQQVMGRAPAINVSGFGSWSKKIETSLKKNEKNTRATAQKTTKAQKQIIESTTFERGTVGPRQAGGFGRGKDPTFGAFSRFGGKKGIFGMGRAQRLSGAASSAAIGGGFPLLFGQGAVAAAGGGIGGALGGALGGGFGFGASIVGTLVGTKAQEIIDFRKAIEGLNTSIRATGGSSVFTAKSIRNLAKQMGLSKEEALEAAKSFAQFEAAGRMALLSTFGNEAIFNFATGLKTNEAIMSGMLQISKDLSVEQAKIVRQTLITEGSRAAELKYIELIQQKQKNIQLDRAKPSMWNPLNWMGTEFFRGTRAYAMFGKKRYDRITAEKRADVEERFGGQQQSAQTIAENWDRFNERNRQIAAFKAPEDELNKLLDSTTQIVNMADAMGNSFSNSFMEVIKGSMSVKDAMASMLRSIADEFMDMAAKIIAAQVKMQIVGAFMPGGWFGGKERSVPLGSFGSGSGTMGGYGKAVDPSIRHAVGGPSAQPKASGGPVSGGRPYLVGERGPELFVPRSHGNIVPNNAMGGSNIVVNVDASGSAAEADGDQQRQLGNLIGSAIQAEIVRQQRPGGLLQGVR